MVRINRLYKELKIANEFYSLHLLFLQTYLTVKDFAATSKLSLTLSQRL